MLEYWSDGLYDFMSAHQAAVEMLLAFKPDTGPINQTIADHSNVIIIAIKTYIHDLH